MAQSLGQLLDRVRGARDVLPHLAALERSLVEGGLATIETAPPVVLAKLCSQLSSLPLPQDDPPLHDLLSRLMDALERPAARVPGGAVPPAAPAACATPASPAPPAAPTPPPAVNKARLVLPDHDNRPFDIERTAVIEEVSHSDFMREERAMAPTQFDDRGV